MVRAVPWTSHCPDSLLTWMSGLDGEPAISPGLLLGKEAGLGFLMSGSVCTMLYLWMTILGQLMLYSATLGQQMLESPIQ